MTRGGVILERFILGRTQHNKFKGGSKMKKRTMLLIWMLMVIFSITISVSAQAQEKKYTANWRIFFPRSSSHQDLGLLR